MMELFAIEPAALDELPLEEQQPAQMIETIHQLAVTRTTRRRRSPCPWMSRFCVASNVT